MSKKKKVIIPAIIGGMLLLTVLVVIGIKIFGGKIISEEEAKGIAFRHAQVSEVDLERVYAYLERDDWDRKYNIIFHAEGIKYDYEINARTGNIEDFDVEGMRNPNPTADTKVQEVPATTDVESSIETSPEEGSTSETTPNNKTTNEESSSAANASNTPNIANTAARITEAEAKRLVLERVEGATESDVWMRLDREDGRLVYEGQVIYNRMEYEFEIDADTGTFYSWEVESVHD